MFKFDPGEPVSAAFRAIALSQIDDVLGDLDKADADLSQMIHEGRRRSKKLRGLLRIVRSAFADYAAENAAIRDAAALLSHLRDADVLKHTIEGLAEHGSADADRLRVIAGRLQGAAASDETAGKLRQFRTAFAALRERAEDWRLQSEGAGPLIAGLSCTYRSARRRMHRAERNRGATALHDWRKASKYHGYHLDLFKRAAPDVLAGEIETAERLADCLGLHHDLVVLAEAIAENPERFGEASDRAALGSVIAARRAAIESEAFDLGRQVFAERPKALARRMRAYWRGAR